MRVRVRDPSRKIWERSFEKNCNRVHLVLVSCSHMDVRPYSYFWWCRYFWDPRVSFVTTDEFSVRFTKITSRMLSHDLTAYLTIFNLFKLNELWPYYQQHVNQIILNWTSLKLSFTNIRGLRSNFFDCQSFLKSNFPDIPALWEVIFNPKRF